MARAFLREPDGLVALLDDGERTILSGLMQQTRVLLSPEIEPTGDAFDDLVASMGVSLAADEGESGADAQHRDPALDRLLPTAHRGDDEVAAEFRRLTEEGLRQRKSSNLDVAIDRVDAATEDRVVLDEASAPAFLIALTDVRLLLGERMGMRTEEDAEALHAAMETIADDDPLRLRDGVVRLPHLAAGDPRARPPWAMTTTATTCDAADAPRPSGCRRAHLGSMSWISRSSGARARSPARLAGVLLPRAGRARGAHLEHRLDLGNGALGSLQRHIEPYAVDAVLLSHLHVDHCIDMCGLYVMMEYVPGGPGRESMPTWGPPGTGAHLARAYGDVNSEDLLGVFEFHDLRDRDGFTIGPFDVTPLRVRHPVEAYGFRVEAASGARLHRRHRRVRRPDRSHARRRPRAVRLGVRRRSRHRDPHPPLGSRAAAAAVRAGGVGRLMLTHMPAWNDPEVCRAQASAVWTGEVELAKPGATYPV